MLLKNDYWETIKHHFSEEEKEKINEAYTALSIRPRGVILDPKILGPELVKKINTSQAKKSLKYTP